MGDDQATEWRRLLPTDGGLDIIIILRFHYRLDDLGKRLHTTLAKSELFVCGVSQAEVETGSVIGKYVVKKGG